jgi:hypothetical protein
MTNWKETFRVYRKWLYWVHCERTTIELCHWYQENCRFYFDEIPIYEDSFWSNIKFQLIKLLRKHNG